MSHEIQDQDQALLLELNGQRLQVHLNMVPLQRGCAKMRDTLIRWTLFRSRHCNANSTLCYCKTQQINLKGKCRLNCHRLKTITRLLDRSSVTGVPTTIRLISIYAILFAIPYMIHAIP